MSSDEAISQEEMADDEGDIPEFVEGTILEDEIAECEEIIEVIMDGRLDPSDEENIYTRIDLQFERAKEDTFETLESRFESLGLYNAFRYLIQGIIEEQWFDDKLTRDGQTDHDLKTVTYWFKLYSTVILDSHADISYEFALIRFKDYRNTVTAHSQGGIPAATHRPEASLLGFLTLAWKAIRDILEQWALILSLDEETLQRRRQKLDSEDPKYGFVSNLQDFQGFIVSYTEGQQGRDTHFNLGGVQYFPEEGDIVQFTDHWDDSNPHDTLDADSRSVIKYGL